MSTFHDTIIKDGNGDIHFPRTDAESVRSGDGTVTVEQRLDEHDTQIGSINTSLNATVASLPYIDTANVLKSAFVANENYTATEDCIFVASISNNAALNNILIYLDGVVIHRLINSDPTYTITQQVNIPIKKSQVFKISVAITNNVNQQANIFGLK